MAFAMQTLDPPLDLAFASEGEVYNGSKLVVICKEFRIWLNNSFVYVDLVERQNSVKIRTEQV